MPRSTSPTLRQDFSYSASLRTIISLHDVVEFIRSSDRSVTVQEIASSTGLSTNTVYLYISYLFDMAVPLRRFSDGTYRFWSNPEFFNYLESYIFRCSFE
jgi:hypothetical protein